MAIDPFIYVAGKRFEIWTVHFVAAAAGWTVYMVLTGITSGEHYWEVGKVFVIYFTGILVLVFEFAIQVLTVKRGPPKGEVSGNRQMVVLCLSSFVVGASLMYLFGAIFRAVREIPFLAMDDGSVAGNMSLVLTTLSATLLMRIILRVSSYVVQLLSGRNDA